MAPRMIDELREIARQWMADDPDPVCQAELSELVAGEDWKELEDRFAARLEFGTAGLRGVIGAGPNRMNLAVVRAATYGLCRYLSRRGADLANRGIAIGFDGRRMSPEFAAETARVAIAQGFKVAMFDEPTTTPLLAYAVTHIRAAAGVMVTASHNPPEYNGFKVYWGNGAQIVPPHDVGIANEIEACASVSRLPIADLKAARSSGQLETLGSEIEEHYHAAIQGLLVARDAPRDIRIAYTALHGTGGRHVERALASAGFVHVASVAAQAEPDGEFPTVRFPNPEENGAMDLVLELAEQTDAELVLANDPDADRLAACARDAAGEMVQLTGNDLGCVLAHYLLEHSARVKRQGEGRLFVLSSLVSSPMLGSIAQAHGAHWEQTLTGFKWIANRAMELEATGCRFVFGYEEALGYTVGSLVRDKDGVSAALLTAEMAAWCKAQGRTLIDELELCARRYGLYLSRQVSVTMKGLDGAEQIAKLMDGIRANPPSTVGAHAVLATQDLLGQKRRVRSGTLENMLLPSSNAFALELDGGSRIMMRPSGTEPKIKYYFDLREALGEKEAVQSARSRGERLLEGLVASFQQIVKTLA